MERQLNAIIFAGQGAQYRGMGRDLFDEFEELTERADRVLGYSIKALCLHDEERRLNRTRYTQPALFVTNMLHYLKFRKDGGAEPDFLAGHSLGEYSALYAAGAFDFETGLRLVQHRGELMDQAAGGAMAAILNLSLDALNAARLEHLEGDIEIANFNSPTQHVVAGSVDALATLKLLVEKCGGSFVPLNVSAAFHSHYMQAAADRFGHILRETEFEELRIPVISNLHARPYLPGEIRKNLQWQIRHPVRWTESLWYLLAQGDVQIRELGPRAVLSKLVTQTIEHGVPSSFCAAIGAT